MKNLLISMTALLLLAGCSFDVPLTEKPTREIDPSLLGSWFSLADGESLNVYKLADDQYLVVDDGDPYVCTHSDLSGISFISCKAIGNTDLYGKYAYISYKTDADTLVLMELNDSLSIVDKSPGEIRSIVEEAAKNGTALNPDSKTQKRYKKKE